MPKKRKATNTNVSTEASGLPVLGSPDAALLVGVVVASAAAVVGAAPPAEVVVASVVAPVTAVVGAAPTAVIAGRAVGLPTDSGTTNQAVNTRTAGHRKITFIPIPTSSF